MASMFKSGRTPWALIGLLLATPALQAAAPITAEEQAALRRQEQEREESRQRAAQAEAKLRQAEQEKAELARQAEADKQRLQQELERLRTEQTQTKPDPATEQRAKELKELEKQNAELKRQAEAEKQRLQQKLEELRAEQARPKPDPAAEQRTRQLEQENADLKRQMEAAQSDKRQREKQLAEAKRQVERAEVEKRRLEGEWAATAASPAASESRKTEANAASSAPTVASPTPGLGETIKDCAVCPELVLIPPGEFTMGSPGDEAERGEYEDPQHPVRIGYRLAVGKYEVTFAEWDACVAARGCTHKPDDRGWGRGQLPVIRVSWDDIHQQYLPWLNRQAGLSGRPAAQQYRLLSEAEWEYAARAGSRRAFSFGDSINTDVANYDGNYRYAGSSPKGRYRQQTVPVYSFAPNAFGLYNVHGNVWEWVEDCYQRSYEGAPSDGSAMQTPGCSHRVLRGGSWVDGPGGLRSAARSWESPDIRYSLGGFRLARMLP
jgi:formylglycine-generating enzyme required for sulfatase activity